MENIQPRGDDVVTMVTVEAVAVTMVMAEVTMVMVEVVVTTVMVVVTASTEMLTGFMVLMTAVKVTLKTFLVTEILSPSIPKTWPTVSGPLRSQALSPDSLLQAELNRLSRWVLSFGGCSHGRTAERSRQCLVEGAAWLPR